MIAMHDPAAFALGAFGLWCGLSALLVAGWVALGEFYSWRARRRAGSRRVTAPPERFADLEVDVSWEWPGAR